MSFSAITDNLDLLQNGKIDSATAAQRILEIKENARANLAEWNTHAASERAKARTRLAAEIQRSEQRIFQAKELFERGENPDQHVQRALDGVPRWSDFLEAPPH